MTITSVRLAAALLTSILCFFLMATAPASGPDPIDEAMSAINEQRYADALELLVPLADEGNGRAQNMLGVLYIEGWGVDRDFGQGRQWYEKAAARGDPFAYFNLARLYARGIGVEQDCDKAMEYARTPAEEGNPIAQVNLASLYADGFECAEPNIDEALRWYRAAAEQGDMMAQHSLGAMYALGRGVEQSFDEALKWYRKAAEQGNASSQAALGWMYFAGEGVEADAAKAREWYELAAAQGNERAIRSLEAMDQGAGTTGGSALVEIYMAAPAPDVALELERLTMLTMMLDIGVNIHMGDLEVNDENREQVRADTQARLAALETAIGRRGTAEVGGAYSAKTTSACSKIQSMWADSTRSGLLGDPVIEQDGYQLKITQLARFNGEQPMETPAVIVEDFLVFSDLMNSDFLFVGRVEDGVITIGPDIDRILAAWPDWVKAPSRKNLERCSVTLKRK